MLVAACDSAPPRLPTTYTYNPGAAFTTNISDPDPRRVVKCIVIFEVYDEAAVTELADHNYVIRNAVLSVLGELTLEELTLNRDLQDIAERMVERVNEAIISHYELIVAAFFTDFVLS